MQLGIHMNSRLPSRVAQGRKRTSEMPYDQQHQCHFQCCLAAAFGVVKSRNSGIPSRRSAVLTSWTSPEKAWTETHCCVGKIRWFHLPPKWESHHLFRDLEVVKYYYDGFLTSPSFYSDIEKTVVFFSVVFFFWSFFTMEVCCLHKSLQVWSHRGLRGDFWQLDQCPRGEDPDDGGRVSRNKATRNFR